MNSFMVAIKLRGGEFHSAPFINEKAEAESGSVAYLNPGWGQI